MGLSIVHYLVELHRGSIEAYSEGSGRGARFEVRFPLLETGGEAVRVHPTLVAASESQAFELHPELHGIVALVVDDDEDSREMISIVLRRHGVDVETAGSAAEAWERLEQRIPDVLISDIAMPGEDGCALVERVRSLPPERGGVVPAIALTAHSRAEDRVRVLAAGYQIHVPKPVEPAELVAVLISVLGRYEGRVREG